MLRKYKKHLLYLTLTYTGVLLYTNFSNANSYLPDIQVKFSDKIIHFGAYFVLSALWGFYATTLNRNNSLRLSFVGTLLFGIILELFQEVVNPMRTYENLDVLAYCLGVVFGTIIVAFYERHKLKSK